MAANHAAIMRMSRSNHPPSTSSSNNDNVDSSSISNISIISEQPALDLNASKSLIKLNKIQSADDANYFLDSPNQIHNSLKRLKCDLDNISKNFNDTISHLIECSHRVTQASNNCLTYLSHSVNTTCNEIEESATNQLISTVDKFKQEAAVVARFVEEVKQLKKSIEVLEGYYSTTK